MKPIFVQWGAGNIGRAFIGQVFASNGYRVCFIDIDAPLIDLLNRTGGYTVQTVEGERTQDLSVEDVTAVHVDDAEQVAAWITKADVMGVSVGANIWPAIAAPLARAIERRYERCPERPLDIILAENMNNGARIVRELLTAHLDPAFPFSLYIGLIETSIGKMVPIQDPSNRLLLRAESYDDLIVDERGFINPIPAVRQLRPVQPIEAYVERKLYIHNMGHACTAYLGALCDDGISTIADALEIEHVVTTVRRAMEQAKAVLLHRYGQTFTAEALDEHIDDLLRRFSNRALGDTIFRVGRDLKRKLRWNDRFMGLMIEAEEAHLNWDAVGAGYLAALQFRDSSEADRAFLASVEHLPFREKIRTVSSWDESGMSRGMLEAITATLQRIGASHTQS